MEKHVLSKCDTIQIKLPLNKNPSSIDGIFRKINQKNDNYKKINPQIRLKMKSKYINIILYFIFL
jgi:hypothetical protein